MSLYWWAWFLPNGNNRQAANRNHLIASLISTLVGLGVARLMAITFPFRDRPIFDSQVHFKPTYGAETLSLDFEGLSAFPSDHAALFYALSVGLIYISRSLGIFAVIYTTVFIAFPRIYLGLHFPTDILMGAFIGVVIVIIGNNYLTETSLVSKITLFSSMRTEYFYPVFFILAYQIATMFNDIRWIIKITYKAFGHLSA